MSQPGSESGNSTNNLIVVGDGALETVTVSPGESKVLSSNVLKNVVQQGTGVATKDNIYVVMSKADGGTTMSKPITIVGSSVMGKMGAGTTLFKQGNTILKVQKASPGQTIGKRVVVAQRPGVCQIVTCGTVVQQQGHGSTPVILTQKVAAGGVSTSPVVSTGGTISNVIGGAKVIATTSTGPQSPQPAQGQKFQDVRVDNWASYCLQRLQAMYEKTDYCDLTLRFHSSQEIQVHRVVVNLCTEYFSNLEKLYGLTEGTLILPKDVEFLTMHTIIKFFYTGKLEVRGLNFNDIYRTVKMMNITILIKLLETHSKKPGPGMQMRKEPGRSVLLKQTVDMGSKGLQVAGSGIRLPPGIKSKTVLARVQSPKGGLGSTKTTKKLPIWKERKPPATPEHPPPLEKWQIKEEEPARPTRFEWGDPDDFDPFMPPSMSNHSIMEKPKELKPVVPTSRKAEDIFDSVKNQSQGVKRSNSDRHAASDTSASPSSEPPAAKVPRLDLLTPDVSEECENEKEAEDVQAEDILPTFETSIEEENATKQTDSTIEKKPVILKPALKSNLKKPQKGKSTENLPAKTVRFAPEVEKEGKEKTPERIIPETEPNVSDAPTTTAAATATLTLATSSTPKPTITIPMSSAPSSPKYTLSAASIPTVETTDTNINHSKVITEVIRRFPDLVKENKNIKLKIIQRPAGNATDAAGTSKEVKTKVSYIVLKSTGAGETTPSTTVLKKNASQSTVSKFWETEKTQKKPSPAENTTGPWLCESCGEGDAVLQFDTYYTFRRHLVDVHGERIDARICEHCGQKASKRNLLLYHLYTKHGVQPPKNCTFPHCDRCDYVALSDSLLIKHKQNHDISKEFSCAICNASFKSSSALQSHMSANLHRNKDTKVYECPYCRKPFVRNINLKAHIRSLHRDVARIEEMEDPRLPPDDTLRLITSPAVSGRRRTFPTILSTARASTSTGMVEFVTADSFSDGQAVSYVTADGQPIEIIDPSTLSSLPITLVSSGEDGMSGVASVSTVNNEGQSGSTEYVTGVSQDGSQQAMYVIDGSQGAMELDMSNMGLTLSADGTVIYDGSDASENYIVQDMQGNQFRRMTGIDEAGKPFVYLQMIGDSAQGVAPTMLDESMGVVESPGTSQIFVSSSGMQLPVTTDHTDGQQVIFTTASGDNTILEMVPADGTSHQVVMSEDVLTAHGQEQLEEQQQHLQLVQHESNEEIQQVIEDQMGEPVQELHLVLDQHQQQEKQEIVEHVNESEEMEVVEVQQPESYGEIQLDGSFTTGEVEEQVEEHVEHEVQDDGNEVEELTEQEVVEHAENEVEDHTEQEVEEQVENEVEQHTEQEVEEQAGPDNTPAEGNDHAENPEDVSEVETQEMEVEENTEQLEIDENEKHDGEEGDCEDTQVIDELQDSIQLVEGQTLTLIEEEEVGTQPLNVGDAAVEDGTS